MKAIINGKFILAGASGGFEIVTGKALVFKDKIIDICAAEELTAERRARLGVKEVIDAQGLFVSPGFINVHIHGCVGADTMDADSAGLRRMRVFQAQTGVTAFLPTTMTYDFATIGRALEVVREAMGEHCGARVLGVHMEGPFISEKKKGAQAAKHISVADFSKIAPFSDVVRMITIAPEESGEDFIRRCVAAGIVVSLGHSNASYAEGMRAIAAGATHITHLFNAMNGLHHRDPGLAQAGLDSEVNVELIVDNLHVCPAMQRLVYNAKHGRHIIPITDSIRACGLGEGRSELGGQEVWVQNGEARLADGTLAGSILMMNDGLRNLRENTGMTVPEVVQMVTRTPAEELDMYDKIGELAIGRFADIVLFDSDFRIEQTICGGEVLEG